MGKHSAEKPEEKQNNKQYQVKGDKKNRRGLKIFLRILLVLLIVLSILAGIACWFVGDKLGKIGKEEIDKTAVGISEETSKQLKEYRNIALLGIDSRADD